MASTVSVQNTLRKVGADLRWFVEKNGVNPEKMQALIVVDSAAERDKLVSGFDREFDKHTMDRWPKAPYMIRVLGLSIAIVVREDA